MKQIKFRLRSVLNEIVGYERWYPGQLDSKNFYTVRPKWIYSKDAYCWDTEFIEHRQKDQYTGLKDKNGVEIYEGDIVEDILGKGEVMFRSNEYFVCLMKYEEKVKLNEVVVIGQMVKVIGNIYENPELLKS